MDFLIGSFPRSRTAWVSMLFSHGLVDCVHEGFHIPQPSATPIVGAIDTALILHPQTVKERFPLARYAFIDRPIKDAVAALERFEYPGKDKALDVEGMLIEHRQSFLDTFNPFIVQYADLDNYEGCNNLFRFCVAGAFDLDPYWFRRVDRMDIQIILSKFLKEI